MIGNNLRDEIKKTEGLLNYHVLEGMADWVRVVDKDGIIIYANRTMKDGLGEDILGKLCYTVTCKKEPCSFCITERSINLGEIVQKEEIINGRHFSVKSSPVMDSEGRIFAAVEVFRDVTRERKLEIELANKSKKIKKDLFFAKKIQEKILPDKGSLGNLDIDYIYRPSELLSGDMFDIFHIDKDNIGIYISDVIGHGIAASMMTMFIRQTMRGIKEEILSPSEALSELHRRFYSLDLEKDKYFTIFYGVFNKNTYEFSYANGGHNSIPIKFNGEEIEELLCSGYPVSLLFSEIDYKEKRTSLKPGDKILLYTDGIIECKNKLGEEFGIEGIINVIENTQENVLKSIDDSILEYSWGDQQDDLAMLLMEVL